MILRLNNLIKIIKDNITINENIDMELNEEYIENTPIYSDCFFLLSNF